MRHLTHDDLVHLREGQPLLLTCGADREPALVRVVSADWASVEVTSDVFDAAVPGGSTRHHPVELFLSGGDPE